MTRRWDIACQEQLLPGRTLADKWESAQRAGFDPSVAASDYSTDTFDPDQPFGDDGQDYAETEQL